MGNGQGGAGNFMRNGASGQVSSVDSSSMTVKMADGSSRIVLVSDKTTYENTTKAVQTDVKTGMQVRVIGTANADGSVTASNVTLNPVMFAAGQTGQNPGQGQTGRMMQLTPQPSQNPGQ